MQSDSNLPPCGEIYKDTLGDTVLTSFVTVTVMKMMMIRVIRYHLLRSYSVRIYRYIPSFNFCIRLFLLGNDPPPISADMQVFSLDGQTSSKADPASREKEKASSQASAGN